MLSVRQPCICVQAQVNLLVNQTLDCEVTSPVVSPSSSTTVVVLLFVLKSCNSSTVILIIPVAVLTLVLIIPVAVLTLVLYYGSVVHLLQ
jgi:hypothetical protein